MDSTKSLPKLFVDVPNLQVFSTLKLSVDENNNRYVTYNDSTVHEGTPDILWHQSAYIMTEKMIYLRGNYFDCSGSTTPNTPYIKDYATVAEYDEDNTRADVCVSYIAETDEVIYDN